MENMMVDKVRSLIRIITVIMGIGNILLPIVVMTILFMDNSFCGNIWIMLITVALCAMVMFLGAMMLIKVYMSKHTTESDV